MSLMKVSGRITQRHWHDLVANLVVIVPFAHRALSQGHHQDLCDSPLTKKLEAIVDGHRSLGFELVLGRH